MTFQEIEAIIGTGEEDIFAPFGVPILEKMGDKLSINDFIALPILVNNSYEKTTVIEVKLLDNEIIGYIYFSNNGTIITADNMSDQLFSAYLTDVDVIDFQTKERKILKNYLVVKSDKLDDYLSRYCESSGIWGGYIHEDLQTIPQPNTQTISEIYAIPNLKLPTNWHKESMIRAIQQPFAFERFLKNYHLLELLFDWQAIEDISKFHRKENFDKENFDKAANVLNRYKKEDLDRINYIIKTKCKNLDIIVDKINRIDRFPAIAKDMFYKYGKTSNPLNEAVFNDTLTKDGLFEIRNFTNERGNLIVQPNYTTFILNLTSYWIYRIRSSIAHSKIGEYQLSYTDEAFMVEFAEPLLQEVITQCFTIDEEEVAVVETRVEPEQSVNATSTESIKVKPIKKN